MPVTFRHESGDVYRLTCSALVRPDEWDDALRAAAPAFELHGRPALLCVLENFEGWDRSPRWGDMGFYTRYGKNIRRIAIVCEDRWRGDALLFTGTGRAGDVQCFTPAELDRAKSWLLEDRRDTDRR